MMLVRHKGQLAIAGDGQVSLGHTVIKHKASKLRRLANGEVLVGFAGATADAVTLLERLDAKLQTYPGQLLRAAVELTKDWRTDKYLRKLEAMIAAGDKNTALIISGSGDVVEPDDGLIGLGSGGAYALSAGRAFLQSGGKFSASDIARKSVEIASSICIYTNDHITVEEL
ncbi:MAG: ATP-dependent protease subunit HslV [Pseudomonadota bacterium]